MLIIIMRSKCIFVRLKEPMLEYVKKRAEKSKSTVSDYIRFLIMLDMEKGENNITLHAVNQQIKEMQKSIDELVSIRDQLSA